MEKKNKIEKGDVVYNPEKDLLMVADDCVEAKEIFWCDWLMLNSRSICQLPYHINELTLISKGDFK